MKNFLKAIAEIFEAVNRGRAAAHFSRMGRDDLAKEMLLRD